MEFSRDFQEGAGREFASLESYGGTLEWVQFNVVQSRGPTGIFPDMRFLSQGRDSVLQRRPGSRIGLTDKPLFELPASFR